MAKRTERATARKAKAPKKASKKVARKSKTSKKQAAKRPLKTKAKRQKSKRQVGAIGCEIGREEVGFETTENAEATRDTAARKGH